MENVGQTIGAAVCAFLASNIDGFAILLGLFSSGKFRAREIVAGHFVGLTVQLLLCAAGTLLAFSIPVPISGLIGILPILLGIRRLWNTCEESGLSRPSKRDVPSGTLGRCIFISIIATSTGADNACMYLAAFTGRSHTAILAAVSTLFLMMTVCCFIAYCAVNRLASRTTIGRYVDRMSPALMVGLGLAFLIRDGGFSLMSSLLCL